MFNTFASSEANIARKINNNSDTVFMITTERIVARAAELGAQQALERVGLSAPEITKTQARRIYGQPFTQACLEGRIQPSRRTSDARNTPVYFRVSDILALFLSDEERAYRQQVMTL